MKQMQFKQGLRSRVGVWDHDESLETARNAFNSMARG